MKEFDESWADFVRLYQKYQKRPDGFYLCWNEDDLSSLLSGLLRNRLSGTGLFVHTKARHGMRFTDEGLQGKWVAWKKQKRMGDVDLLVCKAEEKDFELAVELKYSHTVEGDPQRGGYPATTDARSAELLKQKLASQYKDLCDLRALGIAKEISVVVVDAYYHRKGMLESRILPDSIPKSELKFLKG